MPALSLTEQLAHRTRSFLDKANVSQRRLARYLHIEESHLSKFLNGNAGLSAESTLALAKLMNATPAQLEFKLKGAVKLPCRIMSLQEKGAPMRLDNGGWVSGGSGQSGEDPNDSTDITGTNANPARSVPDQEELEFLSGLAALHQKIIDRISAWQSQKKAKPNQGPTESQRYTPDNAISSRPGSRGDKFSRR